MKTSETKTKHFLYVLFTCVEICSNVCFLLFGCQVCHEVFGQEEDQDEAGRDVGAQ